MNHRELLTAIGTRRRSLGIGLAADYLRELQVCLGGGCPSRLLEGVTPRQWRMWMSAAKQKLVYHHPEMRPIARGLESPSGTVDAEGSPQPSRERESDVSAPHDRHVSSHYHHHETRSRW